MEEGADAKRRRRSCTMSRGRSAAYNALRNCRANDAIAWSFRL
jgi:hypothetical protein